jgi:hypothetical protein
MEYQEKNQVEEGSRFALDGFQRLALGGMLILTILTFIGANLHARLWQSSEWLVSTVLPAVVVDLTNDERADLGESTLKRSATLDEAARMKAQHMANNEYFSHYAPDGTSPWYWFDRAGYTYAHAGENLAIHFTDSDEVVGAWMKSPTHRANIVSGKYTEIGVGTAKGTYDGYDTVYVVQLFGTPAALPVVKTTSAKVTSPTVATATPAPAAETQAVAGNETAAPEQVEVTGIEEIEIEEPEVVEVAPVAAIESEVPQDVVVIEKPLMATSSGLAVATIIEEPQERGFASFVALVTKPNSLLQIIYLVFGVIVVSLLIASVVSETRRMHYIQAAYGVGLLILMGGLWYVHALLTTGAVVV